MAYETNLEQYRGPLDKLLELIEAQKLEISAISLCAVTEEFLAYLETIKAEQQPEKGERAHIHFLVEFLVIASRLVLLKSKSLIPSIEFTREEEEGIQDLETRLKLYRELKPAMKHLHNLWDKSATAYARPYFLHLTSLQTAVPGAPEVFYPGNSLDAEAIVSSLKKIIAQWEALVEETEVIQEKIVTLEEQMAKVVSLLEGMAGAKLSELAASGTKSELILTFIAILHLARDQMIILNQKENFSDILINQSEA